MSAILAQSGSARSFNEADLRIAEVTGQCSLWWRQVPRMRRHRVGYIGHLAASPGRSIEAVLDLACDQLHRQGCTLAIGPIDGSTWRSYRLVTESSPFDPFLFEPSNPPEWPRQFLHAGFRQIASYFSSLVPDLSRVCRDTKAEEQRLREFGIRIRPLDRERFDSDLRIMYRIATEAFADSFLYSSIDWLEFSSLYYPLRASVHPELVLIAEMHGAPAGFIFAMPDLLQTRRGAEVDTIIIKSLGVLPPYTGLGLGSILVEEIHRSAGNRGYKRAIHALMHDDNMRSARISSHYGKVFRRYGLFARHLDMQP